MHTQPAFISRPRHRLHLAVLASLLAITAGCDSTDSEQVGDPQQPQAAATNPPVSDQHCAALATTSLSASVPNLRIISAEPQPEGTTLDMGFGGMQSPPLPAHCAVSGLINERTGQDGEPYAIRFLLRLPEDWNGRFLFEGGGGTNGNTGNALGMLNFGAPPALSSGYAVVSNDSGHNNQINNDPALGGIVSFGNDAQARADFGHASLKATHEAASALIDTFYARAPDYRYFAGCSKGGQEGLAFAQRYPASFDGILAGAPGMSLPKAALGHALAVQAFAPVISDHDQREIPVSRLADSMSTADLDLAREAVLAACDADDGLADGIVGTFAQCSTAQVMPEFRARQCAAEKTASCLSEVQIDALETFFSGPRNSAGEALYTSFPWDGGMNDAGWRSWLIGTQVSGGPSGAGMSIAVGMGAGALATVFSTPPTVLEPGPQAAFNYLLNYDFDEDAQALFATSEAFPVSAWEEQNARSPDLSGFAGNGGKLLVYHGASDPVFSINDTIAWWEEVNERMHGEADDTVRVFPVPGMGHCSGGPSTSQFDAFGALQQWVEQGQAPERIKATAAPTSPWPGRGRPLCPYPEIARYDGNGDIEQASSFRCELVE